MKRIKEKPPSPFGLNRHLKKFTVKYDWQLTRRELKVLEYLRDGLCAKEIAEKMHVTLRCTRFHMGNIYRKFGVRDRVGLHQKVGFHTRSK